MFETNFQHEVQRHSYEVLHVGGDITGCYHISVAFNQSRPVRKRDTSPLIQTSLACATPEKQTEVNRIRGFVQSEIFSPLTCSRSRCPRSLFVHRRRSWQDVHPSGRRSWRCRRSCSPVISPPVHSQERELMLDVSFFLSICDNKTLSFSLT